MVREIQIELDDAHHSQIEKTKEQYGYSWEELIVEGAKRIEDNDGEFPNRNRLEAKLDSLREEFGDRDHHSTFRISSIVDEQSGNEYLGIRIHLMDTDHLQLSADLEDIDRSLYDDGYNTAWGCERQRTEEDAFIPEGEYLYEGVTSALLIEDGVPKIPSIGSIHTELSTHQNIH